MSQGGILNIGDGSGGLAASLTPDTGGPVPAVAGTIPTLGQQAITVHAVETNNDGAGNLRIEDRTWQTQYVVDPSATIGLRGTFQTIQAAINQASSDGASLTVQKEIYIRYAHYTENLTIPPGIFLRGECLFNTPAIPLYTSITGNHTLSTTNVSKFEKIEFINPDPTADLFTSGGATIIYNCMGCVFQSSSTGLFFTLNFSDSYFSDCLFIGNSFQTGIAITSSAGNITFENCFLTSMGFTLDGGNIRFLSCQDIGPVQCTAAQITAVNSSFLGNTYCVNGTGGSCFYTNTAFSCNSSVAPIQFTGSENYLANCSIVGGTGTVGIYNGGCQIGTPTAMAGSVYTRTLTSTNAATDQNTFYIGVTNTSSARTITLTTPAGLDRTWIVKDESMAAATHNITVVAQGGGTIDGAASYVINQNGGAAQFISDGAGNFFVMNQSSAPISAGVVTSVSGTANRVTSTGGTTPVIDISGSYVGQASITTLGTVATGTWNGTVVSPTFGGTGVNNGANTLTLAGNLQTSGAFNSVFTMTGATNVTFPTSGTLSTTTGTVTSVSGTSNRVTSTGGNTPVIDISAAYVGQSSLITLGTVTTGTWNATTIGPTFGGTGLITYTTGDTIYASASNVLSKLAVGSNGQVLTLASGIPSWATPTTGTVTSVSGTANRVTSTGGATPVIDISASYVGQSSITTLGTIATGVWNGTAIGPTFGGTGQTTYTTGDIVYASSTNVLSKLPIGSTNKVLTVISGIPSWVTPVTSIGTINGDSGSITGTTVTIFSNTATKNCGSTVKFVNSGTTSTLNVTDALSNVFIGSGAGNSGVTGANNSGQGRLCLASVGAADSNCALGSTSLTNLTSGSNNCAVGVIALQNLTTGSNCVGIGRAAGQSYTGSESNNICIGSGVTGTLGESNVTRIGTGASACIISGISGVTTSNTNMVTINTSTGQLGSAPTAFTQVVVQVFTSSGTYTPTSGMQYATVELVGGGGGGGGAGASSATQSAAAGGGGGGAYTRKTLTAATIGSSQTITIGAAGTAGTTAPGTGGTGGTSSFGAILSAVGGSGGAPSIASSLGASIGGIGGSSSGGDFNCNGTPGGAGFSIFSVTGIIITGMGGSSFFGGGGISNVTDIAGDVAKSYGGGGGGAATTTGGTAITGGAGFKGICIVTEYI